MHKQILLSYDIIKKSLEHFQDQFSFILPVSKQSESQNDIILNPNVPKQYVLPAKYIENIKVPISSLSGNPLRSETYNIGKVTFRFVDLGFYDPSTSYTIGNVVTFDIEYIKRVTENKENELIKKFIAEQNLIISKSNTETNTKKTILVPKTNTKQSKLVPKSNSQTNTKKTILVPKTNTKQTILVPKSNTDTNTKQTILVPKSNTDTNTNQTILVPKTNIKKNILVPKTKKNNKRIVLKKGKSIDTFESLESSYDNQDKDTTDEYIYVPDEYLYETDEYVYPTTDEYVYPTDEYVYSTDEYIDPTDEYLNTIDKAPIKITKTINNKYPIIIKKNLQKISENLNKIAEDSYDFNKTSRILDEILKVSYQIMKSQEKKLIVAEEYIKPEIESQPTKTILPNANFKRYVNLIVIPGIRLDNPITDTYAWMPFEYLNE